MVSRIGRRRECFEESERNVLRIGEENVLKNRQREYFKESAKHRKIRIECFEESAKH